MVSLVIISDTMVTDQEFINRLISKVNEFVILAADPGGGGLSYMANFRHGIFYFFLNDGWMQVKKQGCLPANFTGDTSDLFRVIHDRYVSEYLSQELEAKKEILNYYS